MTLICILCWSAADIFYKKGSAFSDKLSHMKIMVWLGIVMGITAILLLPLSEVGLSLVGIVIHYREYIPVAVLYVLALLSGTVGSRYLDVSLTSPLENIDGAVAALILLLYFSFTGGLGEGTHLTVWNIGSILFVTVGVVLLGIQEHRLSQQEKAAAMSGQRRHALGAIAFIFPLLYTLVDACSMVFESIVLAGGEDAIAGQFDFLICECTAFALAGLISWLYLLVVKKTAYNPFQKGELVKCGAALTETMGNISYAMAAAANPLLTPPVTTGYCVLTILGARLFLKEKLTGRQYLCLALVLAGVVLSAAAELLKG